MQTGAVSATADLNQEAFGTDSFSGDRASDLLDELADQAPASTVRLVTRFQVRDHPDLL